MALSDWEQSGKPRPGFLYDEDQDMMKMNSKRLIAAAVLASIAASSPLLAGTLKTEKDKYSYGIGVDVATNFKRLGIDASVEALVKGIRDAYGDKKLELTDAELQTTMAKFQHDLMEKQAAKTKTLADGNKKIGENFLAENRTKEGVVTLASGLQYKVLKAGDGPKPGDADTIECNYRGTLINGKEFDSSARLGKPAVFTLQTVIPGWREALKLMPVGSKWQIFIPSDLAYGPRGAGREIGPNEALVFELELLKTLPPATAAPPADPEKK